MARHSVFLIPGFFGFASFGEFKYWSHAHAIVEQLFEEAGVEVKVVDAVARPTASIRRRAGNLAEHVLRESEPGDRVHLIGHSTGGLDARLVASPRARLRGEVGSETIAGRIRSVVGIASPHYGTPVAALFLSVMGQRLLRLFSLSTIHAIRLGSIPLPALLALTTAFSGKGEKVMAGVLDQVFRQVLRDFKPERQKQIEEYFAEAAKDQALLTQLSPESMDLFNASVVNREGVRYGSVLARARRPNLAETARIGLDPLAQANQALYRTLAQLSSTHPERYLPALEPELLKSMTERFEKPLHPRSNDALVPTISQVWGELIHAAWADHLDVIGHFRCESPEHNHVDWLRSGSGYSRASFERMWRDIVAFLLAD